MIEEQQLGAILAAHQQVRGALRPCAGQSAAAAEHQAPSAGDTASTVQPASPAAACSAATRRMGAAAAITPAGPDDRLGAVVVPTTCGERAPTKYRMAFLDSSVRSSASPIGGRSSSRISVSGGMSATSRRPPSTSSIRESSLSAEVSAGHPMPSPLSGESGMRHTCGGA